MANTREPRFRADSERFQNALTYSTKLHADQTRKSTDLPYASHLMGVSSLVMEYGGGEDEAIGGLLHDAAEDCGGWARFEDIRQKFGEQVAEIVEACTDTFEDPKPEWIERKAQYVAHIPDISAAARLVSAADKLHNARAILRDFRTDGLSVFDRFRKDKYSVLWYYRALAKTFLSIEQTELNRELERVVDELEKLVIAASPSNEAALRDQTYRALDEAVERQKSRG
jgi:(p)ppGpp synthase/HD superfamily hydrolase